VCNISANEQYWQWTKHNHILHMESGLCLASEQDGETLRLKPCNRENSTQEWLCAGRYVEQPESRKCVTVEDDRNHLEEALEQLLNNQTLEESSMDTGQGLMVATVRDCDPTQTKQVWNAKHTHGKC